MENIDVLDGTPLLDIKPHARRFDQPRILSQGWLAENFEKPGETKDDGRFAG